MAGMPQYMWCIETLWCNIFQEWKRSHCHKTRSHSGKSCCNKEEVARYFAENSCICLRYHTKPSAEAHVHSPQSLQMTLLRTKWGTQHNDVSLEMSHFSNSIPQVFEWGIEYRPEWKQFGTGFLFSGLIWSGSSTVLLDRNDRAGITVCIWSIDVHQQVEVCYAIFNTLCPWCNFKILKPWVLV